VKGVGKAPRVGVACAVLMAVLLPVCGGRQIALADSPPRVVLTFDDGYNLDHRILDYLSSQGIAADAFVVGAWAQNNHSLLEEMNRLGWEICNHTQNHPWLTKIPDQQIQAELNACQSVISSITGQHQPFFRPTWGAMDNRVLAVVSSMGYIPVMWDFDSMDSAGTNVASIETRVANIVGSARDGSKILFHFGGLNTYELVTGVVRGLQARGFSFVTLGELYGLREEAKGGEAGQGLADTTTRFYLAEGNTRPGFEEWLLILNPSGVTAKVQATFFSPQGRLEKTFTVPPRARQSISINAEVPWRDDLSAVVESSVPVSAERMIYFNRGMGLNGGSLSPGVSNPSTRHLFAEGSTRPGFEEWLIMFNPSGTTEAQVEVGFHGEAGKVEETKLAVPPLTRVTARVNDLVEGGGDISIIMRSSIPVVAERSQYFLYDGRIAGSYCTPGVSAPFNQWYFAEGTTRSFYENYLTLFNPCAYSTWIKVRLPGSDGQAREEMVDLDAGARKTLHLNEYMPADIDFSIHVSSLLPVVAERSAYFQSHNVAGGYCTRGTPQAQTYLLFPEGCTAPGYQEWLALFNPSKRAQEVRVEYLRGEGEAVSRSYVLPPEGRQTIDVAAEVGQEAEVSIEVEAPGGVVAERSVYFSRPVPN
jgi:peptidoglycan-N-acetylglucosamine deacetylase